MDLKGLTAVELGKKIQAKEVTVKEAVEACFAQIDKVEKEVSSSEPGKSRCSCDRKD